MSREIFSRRLPGELKPNAFAELLARRKPAFDLTESNPTVAGIEYPVMVPPYQPEPFGLLSARESIAREYGAPVDRVVLTASTSEAYSWLFKLLCDPGDEVLVPRPSYPLFEYLAALESVKVSQYSLFYDHGWHIDFHTVRKTERTKAIVLVNPNNPTGHFLKRHELPELVGLGLPIISDEVFRDYLIEPAADAVQTLGSIDAELVFTLNGLSKTVGLPQMKLGWMVASGTRAAEALERLEIIADTYLSVGTPVQLALPELLKLRGPVQSPNHGERQQEPGVPAERGIERAQRRSRVVRGVVKDEDAAISVLRDHGVLVQPGYFYDFEKAGYLVVSLLTRPEIFRAGMELLLRG